MEIILKTVKICLAVLKGTKSDTEKFAGLFIVSKLVTSNDCNVYSTLPLFEATGLLFQKCLLFSQNVSADYPPQIYKSVIVQHADADDYEDNLITINEAYEFLQNIAFYDAG
ncbi:hypothetical protein PGB90_004329 [Kerria lacca]